MKSPIEEIFHVVGGTTGGGLNCRTRRWWRGKTLRARI